MRPLLLLDVDGVFYPTSGAAPPGFARVEHNGFSVLLNKSHGPWLQSLTQEFDLAWVSTWAEKANAVYSKLFGLPELPIVPLALEKSDETRKLKSVMRFVNDRPFAWVDDEIFQDAFDWTYSLPQRTLLVRTRASVGLTVVEFERLKVFSSEFTGRD